jgi:surface carbohydrate biosynthesis protein
MKNLLKGLIKFIYSNWVFAKPIKAEILIYDGSSKIFFDALFKNRKFSILYTRFEQVNFYILIKSLLKYKFKYIKDNYKKEFITAVNPKIVFTSTDNNPSFYRLKKLVKKPIYISVQNGMRNSSFLQECKKLIRKGIKLESDFSFVFGKNEKDKLKKIVKSNIQCSGNIINNLFISKKKNLKKRTKNILFISQLVYKMLKYKNYPINTLHEEKKIFRNLIVYCKKKNYDLTYCCKSEKNIEPILKKIYKSNDWNYFPRSSLKKTYKKMNKMDLLVFGYSTLGYEGISKGIRGVSFNKNFPISGCSKKYKKKGPFWSNNLDYHSLEKKINNVLNFSEERWKRCVKKYSNEILMYNPKNSIIKNAFSKILKK